MCTIVWASRCDIIVVVVVVLDAGSETRCVFPPVIGPIGKLPVPSHLGLKLPATPAPPALVDQQLLVIKGPRNHPKNATCDACASLFRL